MKIENSLMKGKVNWTIASIITNFPLKLDYDEKWLQFVNCNFHYNSFLRKVGVSLPKLKKRDYNYYVSLLVKYCSAKCAKIRHNGSIPIIYQAYSKSVKKMVLKKNVAFSLWYLSIFSAFFVFPFTKAWNWKPPTGAVTTCHWWYSRVVWPTEITTNGVEEKVFNPFIDSHNSNIFWLFSKLPHTIFFQRVEFLSNISILTKSYL